MKPTSQTPASAPDGSGSAPDELILAGHSGGITAAAFSPDGRTLVTSGADGFLLFWDLPSLELRAARQWNGRPLCEDHPYVTELAFSPDGAYLAASDWDMVSLLDPATGRVIRRLRKLSQPFAFSPDGKAIAGTARQQSVDTAFVLLDVRSRRIKGTLSGLEQISSIAFSIDGKLFGVTSYTCSERWYDSKGKYHSDGAHLVTVCDASTGNVLHQWCWDQEIKITAWPQADGPRLLVFVENHAAPWDAESGNIFEIAVSGPESDSCTNWWARSSAYIPQGPYFVTPLHHQDPSSGEAGVWRAGDIKGEPTYEIATPPYAQHTVAFLPDGSRFAARYCDTALTVWSLAGQAEKTGMVTMPSVRLEEIAFDEDGTTLRIRSAPGKLRTWNLTTGEVSPPFDIDIFRGKAPRRTRVDELSGDWLSLAQPLRGMRLGDAYRPTAIFSADGRFAVTKASQGFTYDPPADACLWDTGARSPIAEITDLPSGNSFHAQFSPDGAWLALSVGYEKIRLLDGRTGELRRDIAVPAQKEQGYDIFDEAISFAFSPDGKTFASGHVGFQICFWDVQTGGLKRRIHAKRDSISSLAFDPSGKSLAVATSYWENISLCSIRRGGFTRSLKGHTGSLESVAYSPDGRWLASAADDGAVKLWDASTLQCLATLRLLPDGDEYLLTTPEGYYCGSEGVEQYFRVRRGGEIMRDDALVSRFREAIAFPV